jgi:hypothetical protein
MRDISQRDCRTVAIYEYTPLASRMVEKHYGHLAPSFVADAIRAGAPRFGGKAEPRVVPMHRPRR